ncbi:unnamed protein product [Ectocarpus sp. 12 AP-2014]
MIVSGMVGIDVRRPDLIVPKKRRREPQTTAGFPAAASTGLLSHSSLENLVQSLAVAIKGVSSSVAYSCVRCLRHRPPGSCCWCRRRVVLPTAAGIAKNPTTGDDTMYSL